MPIPIPPDFDYLKEIIDPNETIVRDVFRLNLENWAKFRHAIGVGTDPTHLKGSTISDDLKDAYRELGKCHYEVVCSVGYCKYALLNMQFGNDFVLGKSLKDFYFHAGSMLDNLSRLVYIINIPNAAIRTNKKGQLVRRLIDRGQLLRDHSADITSYLPSIDSKLISELISVRNAYAHYWSIPMKDREWPRDQLSHKAFAWPYHDPLFLNYSGWTAVPIILKEHIEELIRSQDATFGLLLNDIAKFETNNGVTIA